jgi:hypothetical protein
MATTTNYGWTTPDDTALVKDGASAIRSLGPSVDTTTKALNPSTTLGDIEYRSSTPNTNTRLPLGTAGQVLKVNSGATAPEWATDASGMTNPMTTTGDTIYSSSGSTPARLGIGSTGQVLTVASGLPSWATPSGAGSNYSLLNAGGTTLSGTSTTVSGISSKEKLIVLIIGASSSGAQAGFQLNINSDTGGNYNYAGNLIAVGSTYAVANFQPYDGTAGTNFPAGQMSAAAGSTVATSIAINGGTTTGGKQVQINSAGTATASNSQYLFNIQGVYLGSAVISSVTLTTDSGSFDAGKIYVYGSAV